MSKGGLKLRICKVWDYEYPWDVRVEKVCRALVEAGHDVHLTARNRHRRPRIETMEEAVVHRLTPTPWFGRRVESALMFPAFLNPRWVVHIHGTALEISADVILVRDIPLAPTAIWVGHHLGVPVVLDMAENYGAMMRDLWATGATRLGDRLVRNPRIVEAVERWCLRHLEHVIVVVEESRDRLVALGYPEDRITVVSNTPSVGRLHDDGATRIERAGDALEIVYLGLMERARGVSELIQATAHILERGVPAHLTLIGDGRASEAFRAEVASLGIGDAVAFKGFMPHREALRVVAASDVGVIPHHVTESWNSTIPNKLFDYMAAGIAVVASDAVPVARVLAATSCGFTFRDRDPEDLARVLEDLARMPERSSLGMAGRGAVAEEYNWEADSRRLVTALEGVVAGAHASSPARKASRHHGPK